MSMFRTFSDAVQAIFSTVTTTCGSVQKALDTGNDYIDNQHKSLTRGFAKQAILDTSKQHDRIQAELDANPNLASLFDQLEAEWDLPKSEWVKPKRSTKK